MVGKKSTRFETGLYSCLQQNFEHKMRFFDLFILFYFIFVQLDPFVNIDLSEILPLIE